MPISFSLSVSFLHETNFHTPDVFVVSHLSWASLTINDNYMPSRIWMFMVHVVGCTLETRQRVLFLLILSFVYFPFSL